MPKPPIEDLVAQLPAFFKWRPGPVTDWIDMELVLEEIDPATRTQLVANRLETLAAVHKNIADGAKKAAGIVAGARVTGGRAK
jgi:hypothetical protein